jgi:hypothetical protein
MMNARRPQLRLIRGGAHGSSDEEVMDAIVRRLGGNQQACDYIFKVVMRRRTFCDVKTGRQAAPRLTAMPVYGSR